MTNQTIHTAFEWFGTHKAPSLRAEVDKGIKKLDADEEIPDNWKKFFAFILFSYSMNMGPTTFFAVEEAVKEIGVGRHFEEYANNWITHSKGNKDAAKPAEPGTKPA